MLLPLPFVLRQTRAQERHILGGYETLRPATTALHTDVGAAAEVRETTKRPAAVV